MATPLSTERVPLAGVSPSILNITLVEANTEYVFSIPKGTRAFALKTRISTQTVKFSFTEGQSNIAYITLNGTSWSEDNILAGFDVYVQSPFAGCVLEILLWS